MICPNCHVYDVDPDSKERWCTKCTGVFAHLTLPSTPAPLLDLIKRQTAYLLIREERVLFAQKQVDECPVQSGPLYRANLAVLEMAILNRERAQRDLAQLKGAVQS